jgi:hypothetical protein
MLPPPRHTDRPLPATRFTPGTGMPHPVNDLRGFLYGVAPDDQPVLPATLWREQAAYLWGVDLFNAGYDWEAHEAWENLWRDAADPSQKLFLHALIQLAAALLKRRMKNRRGLLVLGHKAEGKLRRVAMLENMRDGSRYMGVEVLPLIQRLERGLEALAADPTVTFDLPLGLA